jgi:hypothetical protein
LRRRSNLALRIAALGASAAIVASGLAAGAASAAGQRYRFQTLNNNSDTTFNQLLGINDAGAIAGYFGSGAKGHPNMGYLAFPTYYQNAFASWNYPGSMQTQVTGLSNSGLIVGFWSDMNNANMTNDNFGFYRRAGKFHNVNFPTSDNSSPAVNQLLGVNDANIAVGFYNDHAGNSHGYTYNVNTGHFRALSLPQNVMSDTAAAINDHGDVAGFASVNGTTEAFLLRGGRFTALNAPGSAMTQAFGVNNQDEVVGVYTVGSGNNAKMHGFTWKPGRGFTTVDDPHGVGSTTINGVNDKGQLVGFYTDAAGNTDGLIATPNR